MRNVHHLVIPALAALALAAPVAGAQAKGKAQAQGKVAAAHAAPPSDAPGQKKVPPGQAKKVTTDDAISATRAVLVNNGYRVVRVEQAGLTRVIWYRRGNMGNGKGQGPLMKMVVRPSNDIVVFDSGPRTLIDLIKQRLGL